MTVLKVVGSLVVSLAIAYLVVYMFFGETTVSASYDGREVTCDVLVNGKNIGQTPLKTKLGAGFFHVEVRPPAGYRVPNEYYSGTAGRGFKIGFNLEKIGYKVNLKNNGTPAYFEIYKVGDNKTLVGDCDGAECTVDLPGPGKYRAKMEEDCDKEACPTGNSRFEVTDEENVMNLSWD